MIAIVRPAPDGGPSAATGGGGVEQRDLSVSQIRLGDVAVAAGDPAGAGAHYQAGLDITARLVAADPANAQWRDDLAYVQGRIRELEDSDAEG